MKIILNSKTDITSYITSVTWGGSAYSAARELSVSVINSTIDKNIETLDIKLGDRISLSEDYAVLINAMVSFVERSSENDTVTIRCYDDLNYLLRSKGSYNFKNTTPETIAKKLCQEFKIGIGDISKTNVHIKKMLVESETIYDVIISAFKRAKESNGNRYQLIMFGSKLSVIKKGEIIDNFTLAEGQNITSSQYSQTLDEMVNRVKIYNDEGKFIGEVKNSENLKKYGIFQDTYTKEKGKNSNAVAKSLLKGITNNATVDAIGNTKCISGYGISIKDKATGLMGEFWIENDTHTWENGIHTMSLALSFRNIMGGN